MVNVTQLVYLVRMCAFQEWVDEFHALVFYTVTFEGVLSFLDLGARVQVLHCHTTWEK